MSYDLIYEFKEGFAVVKKDRKYGLINTNREVIAEYKFDEIYNFKEKVWLGL